MRVSKAEFRRRFQPGTEFEAQFLRRDSVGTVVESLWRPRRVLKQGSRMVSQVLDAAGKQIYLNWSHTLIEEESDSLVLFDTSGPVLEPFLRVRTRPARTV